MKHSCCDCSNSDHQAAMTKISDKWVCSECIDMKVQPLKPTISKIKYIQLCGRLERNKMPLKVLEYDYDKIDIVTCSVCGDELDEDRDDYIQTMTTDSVICQVCLETLVSGAKTNGK